MTEDIAPTGPASAGKRSWWPCCLVAGVLAAAGVGLAALALVGVGWALALGPPSSPALLHVHDLTAFVAEADALMADPKAHGVYGGPDQMEQDGVAHGEQPRRETYRPLAELPALVRQAGPIQVSVSEGGVTLSWPRGDRTGYGHYLTIVTEAHRAETAARMAKHHGNFYVATQVAPRAWSHFPVH
jgi:hypothetical protein